jgi:L,D-peptidoglycan transpeptidase YkuD (ErfK/YbiS/YcfS/YnhG family)
LDKKKLFNLPVIVPVAAGIIVLLIVWMVLQTPKPPVRDMDYARSLLTKAGTTRAGTYSVILYSEARAAYDSAMICWHLENKKLILLRDYDKVRSYALLSAKKAEQAAETSITNSNMLILRVKEMIDTLKKVEIKIDSLFGRYPFSNEVRLRISNGKMLLREGEIAYEKGQYPDANMKIIEAGELIFNVYENTTNDLKSYFSSFTIWEGWVKSALRESKQKNSYSIIIDKFAKKCYLYYKGKKRYEFDAELGRNWIGYKKRMGDKTTPEGMYRIERKLQDRATPYHKSLAIDYPNKEDRERFRKEVDLGVIPASSKIGGGIELHGEGGKGVDWTDGCIALNNNDIDMLFRLVKVGTPVTIVGSMRDFDAIFSE